MFKLDHVLIGPGPLTRQLPADGSEHTLEVWAAGYRALSLQFSDRRLPSAELTLERLPVTRAPKESVVLPAELEPSAKPSSPPVPVEPIAPLPPAQRYGTNGAPILR